MFRSGSAVAEALGDLRGDQPQPNGVDLTVAAVYRQTEPGHIGTDGKTVGEREQLEATDGVFALEGGAYVVEYGDRVVVPENHVGFVLPRSSLLRNSCELHTAVWDAGYEGRGEGLLVVNHPIELERGARIAQFVVAEAEHESTYDGTYQGENLERAE